jgi:hypothetical protein
VQGDRQTDSKETKVESKAKKKREQGAQANNYLA